MVVDCFQVKQMLSCGDDQWDDTYYLLNVWYRNKSSSATFITDRPPLLLILTHQSQDFSTLEW